MKKTYIKPVAEVYSVNTKETLLSLSGGDTLGAGGKTTDKDFAGPEAKEDSGWDIW